MPKKQKQHYSSKVATSYVHPSLATSAQTATDAGPISVNDRLEQLRRLQGHRAAPKDLSASQYAPRPSQRRVAGPPPPRSWLVGSLDGDESSHQGVESTSKRLRPPRLDGLPGLSMPAKNSLLDHTLRSMARDMAFHIDYDRQYLSLLPLEIRSQLLSYIASFGSEQGISLLGLRQLFTLDYGLEAQGAAAAEDLMHLDLTGSVGRAIHLKDLEKAWTKKAKTRTKQAASDDILESWDQEIDFARLTLDSRLWFPSLTHLSLAYPARDISWTDLLSFSKNLSALTHLSLSNWPRPTLPKAAGTQGLGDLYASGSDDSDEDDARVVLHAFSRNTPSLEWLSVARCHGWLDDLSPRKEDFGTTGRNPPARLRRGPRTTTQTVQFGEGGRGAETGHRGGAEFGAAWTGSWRHLKRVEVGQEWLPVGLTSPDLQAMMQGRTATVAGPTWETDVRAAATLAPPGRAEAYRIIAPSEAMKTSIEQQQARRVWLANEARALSLGAKVRTLRAIKGLGRCEFEYGWHKDTLLEAGYDEHVLFEAGL